MKSPLLKPAFYLAALGIAASSLALRADSLTVEGDLNVDGKIGVGTGTPSEKVEVEGNVKVNGTLTTTGAVTATSVTLPDGSSLTSAKTTTLYNAAGQPVATVDASGKVVFANGIAVGSDPAATITPNSAVYLNQTLTNLGYRENPIAPGQLLDLGLAGDIRVTSMLSTGGYTYAVGYTRGECSIGGFTFLTGNDYVGFIAKVPQVSGAAGGWAKVLGGSSYLHAVAVDATGNVLTGGTFTGTITSVAGTSGINVSSAPASRDGLLVKLSGAGVVQWAKAVGNANDDFLSSVAVDSAGNVFTGGTFAGTITSVAGTSGINVSSAGARDGLIVKFSGAGVAQWAKAVGNTSEDYLSAIAVDSAGNVFTGGTFTGTITNVAGTSGINVSSAGVQDGLVVKLNGAGVAQWAKAVGNANNDSLSFIAVDPAGNVFTGGTFMGTITSVAGTSGINVSSAGGSGDGLIVKLSGAGVTQWAKAVGNANYEFPSSIAVDSAGDVFMTLSFAGTLTIGSQTETSDLSCGLIVHYSNAGSFNRMIKGPLGWSFKVRPAADGVTCWGFGNVDTTWRTDAGVVLPSPDSTAFAFRVSDLNIMAPTSGHAAALAWGGARAEDQGVALGSKAYASGEGSAALGSGYAIAPNSFSTGSGRAYGNAASAMGAFTAASGYGATAMGLYTAASGDAATAMGESSKASGYAATAMGLYATASGYAATAMGDTTTASGDAAASMGLYTLASGYAATAMGNSTTASGQAATAMGSYAIASGEGATAMGYGTTAIGAAATAMGENTTARGFAATAMGSLNVVRMNEYPDSSQPTDDLLVVGNGDIDTAPSNAFVVHRNGNTRIAGGVHAKGGFRTPPMGDLSMGEFNAGINPAAPLNDPSPGLDTGLRYPGE